jgi:hypothetical protein
MSSSTRIGKDVAAAAGVKFDDPPKAKQLHN